MPHETPRQPCPECGREFNPRGLAAHRRQRHGVIPPPLPAAVPDSMIQEILGALQILRGAVTRIDEHIRVIELAGGTKETPEQEQLRLERELALLLEEIGRLLRLASSARADVSDGPLADELKRLRLEQARLVFRIDELKKGSPCEERFLT